MQTAAYQNAKNQHFWPSESSDFPRKHLPRPLMYMSYTPKSNSTPIKCKKAYQIECFFGEKNNKLHLGNVSCTIDKALKVSCAVFFFKNRLLMESHLIQTMSVHCFWPFKTSIWFMFSYSFFIFSKFFSLKLSSFFLSSHHNYTTGATRQIPPAPP